MARFLLTLLIASISSSFCILHATKLPCDLFAAEALCDSLPLSGPEGVWSFPHDNVIVLILHDDLNPQIYNISVVQADNCTLFPGDVIGQLKTSPSPQKFTLSLFTKRKRGQLSVPIDCAATLNEESESMIIDRRKISVKFNPLGFLPTFWRSIRINVNDPVKKIPDGMIRIYPSYDGNGSSRRKPRYL